ncbi:MAG: undecaprenyldiphospho-muramoylpentapeptide beta-N-acetylglucosaminyltransferase [Clostridia bacterium]|nr:undecaprenyldiphospho-muramoylpentapeptide beta-N-acetylglucosaminyltransferase [Clostridia bacterium]
MIKIVLTGGGTAGHVMPNVALLEYLKDFEVHYIGSTNGIEKKIISKIPGVIYHGIHTGKLRRYLSLKNVKDFFSFNLGLIDARKLLRKIKPDIIFSKGGYVAVPVAAAARRLKIPLLTHESDYTPGLANRMISNVAFKVLTTFPETVEMIKDGKGEFSGAPIRSVILHGDRKKGLSFLGFKGEKPVLTVIGGSKGSRVLNGALYESLDVICDRFDVVHICGDRNVTDTSGYPDNYRQFAFINEELPDVFAATDYFVTRGGSNSIHEFAALKKPMLIIPLSKSASRGDQILNADSFEKRGIGIKLEEEELNRDSFLTSIDKLEAMKDTIVKNLSDADYLNGTVKIYEELIGKLKALGKM